MSSFSALSRILFWMEIRQTFHKEHFLEKAQKYL
jgi:hypothetical protein